MELIVLDHHILSEFAVYTAHPCFCITEIPYISKERHVFYITVNKKHSF